MHACVIFSQLLLKPVLYNAAHVRFSLGPSINDVIQKWGKEGLTFHIGRKKGSWDA